MPLNRRLFLCLLPMERGEGVAYEKSFETQVLERLAQIETNLTNVNDQCKPCRKKVDELEVMVVRIEASAKSAHHRLDTMQMDRTELKKDLTDAIKDQIWGIYRTAGIIGAVSSFFVGIIMWALQKGGH